MTLRALCTWPAVTAQLVTGRFTWGVVDVALDVPAKGAPATPATPSEPSLAVLSLPPPPPPLPPPAAGGCAASSLGRDQQTPSRHSAPVCHVSMDEA
jgi:hypothetical protein